MPTWSAPVRYAECDQQGIVFNAHYLVWADEACTAWLADSYPRLTGRGLDLRVKAAALVWSGPARFGDVAEVQVGDVEVGRTSFVVPMGITAGGRPSCEVRTTYVVVDVEGRPTRVPDDLRERWTAA